MKIQLPVFYLFLVCQFGFSQTEKLFQAKVFCEDLPLQGIEVLNLVSKKTTITDSNGKFSILAKATDTLMFVSKNYEYKNFILKKEDLEKINRTISLTRKPEQLEEIKIFSVKKISKVKFDNNIANQLILEKAAINRKPTGVYDGTIENGMGFTIPLGGSRKKIHQIEFKELVKKANDENYYLEILKLKPEELGLFIEYCDADPKSKTVLKNTNPLKLMDFLMSKKIEFKKILELENK